MLHRQGGIPQPCEQLLLQRPSQDEQEVATAKGNSVTGRRVRSINALCMRYHKVLLKAATLMCAHVHGRVEGGLAGGLKRVARQIQGALPIVGLLSRLGSPSGGVGNDMLVGAPAPCMPLFPCMYAWLPLVQMAGGSACFTHVASFNATLTRV